MTEKKRKLILIHMLFCVAVAVSMFVWTAVFGSSCPSKIFFKLPCPFCGMTRAWLSFFKFDLIDAFKYQPLFSVSPFYLFLLFHDEHVFPRLKRFRKALLVLITVLFVLAFAIRILPTDIDFFYAL